jgi:hypothetical protein
MTTDTEKLQAMKELLDMSSTSILEYLQRAIPIFRDNLTVLRSSGPENGMNVLIHGVDGLQLVSEYLQSATEATAGVDKDLSASYAQIGAKVQADMGLIVDAMEKNDIPLLADVMEFELIDSLTQLQDLLSPTYGSH